MKNDLVIAWKYGHKNERINLEIENVEGDRRIIRVSDKRLSKVKNYVFRKKVSIEYKGTPDGLLAHISKHQAMFAKQSVFDIGMDILVFDSHTTVNVLANAKSIGDILTHCIPLPGYSRIVWSSYTDGRSDSPIVTTRFYGRRNK